MLSYVCHFPTTCPLQLFLSLFFFFMLLRPPLSTLFPYTTLFRSIQIAWFSVTFPGLLLNYFGQGALLLRNPAAAENPFYHLAPGWALYPLIALATAAAVIASQAVISGAFSLTRQAVQLGYSPRLQIEHTS